MAWGTFTEHAWRARVMGMGYVAGIETALPIARLVASGVPAETAEDLIAACERGFVSAVNTKDEKEEEGESDD